MSYRITAVESNSAVPRVYTEPSKAAAMRLAKAIVKGCVKGEGYVTIYSDAEGCSIKVLRA